MSRSKLALNLAVSLFWSIVAYVAVGRWTHAPPFLGSVGVLLARGGLAWKRGYYPGKDDFIFDAVGALAGVYLGYSVLIITWLIWGIPE